MNLHSGNKNSPMCQIWAWSSGNHENNSSFFAFSTQKMTWHTGNKRLLWQHLTTMVIVQIRKMSIKRCKVKVRKFLFNISWRFGVHIKSHNRTLAEIFKIDQFWSFPSFTVKLRKSVKMNRFESKWFTRVFLMNGTELRSFSHYQILTSFAYQELSWNLQIE